MPMLWQALQILPQLCVHVVNHHSRLLLCTCSEVHSKTSFIQFLALLWVERQLHSYVKEVEIAFRILLYSALVQFLSHLIQPSLLSIPLRSHIDCCSSLFALSSFNILESTLTSSPSTSNFGFGVTASSTKWLSQWGQYSSLSSKSFASFRKHFLHFLQANVSSSRRRRGWSSVSAWHSAQSNHLRPMDFLLETARVGEGTSNVFAFWYRTKNRDDAYSRRGRRGARTAWRSYGNLRV